MRAPRQAANKQTLAATDLQNGRTLSSDRYVDIATVQATKKKFYSHGFGSENRNQGNTGFAYIDLGAKDSGGSATDPTGTLRLVVYESSDLEVPKVILDEYDLQDFREAASQNRSERPIIPVKAVGAAEDEVLAWEVKVDAGYDGHTVNTSDSDVSLPYSEFRRR